MDGPTWRMMCSPAWYVNSPMASAIFERSSSDRYLIAAKSTPPFEQSPPAKEGWRTPLQDWQQEEPPSVGHAERAVTHAIRGTLLKNDSIRRFFSAVELTTTCKSDCCFGAAAASPLMPMLVR